MKGRKCNIFYGKLHVMRREGKCNITRREREREDNISWRKTERVTLATYGGKGRGNNTLQERGRAKEYRRKGIG